MPWRPRAGRPAPAGERERGRIPGSGPARSVGRPAHRAYTLKRNSTTSPSAIT